MDAFIRRLENDIPFQFMSTFLISYDVEKQEHYISFNLKGKQEKMKYDDFANFILNLETEIGSADATEIKNAVAKVDWESAKSTSKMMAEAAAAAANPPARVCRTPGAIFHTYVSEEEVSCQVTLPITLTLSEEEAEKLEDEIHNAMEAVLAKFFR